MVKRAKSPKRKSPKRKSHQKTIGSRREVMSGTALKTPGNLRKKDLKYNKHRRIVSKKRSARAKRENRLVKSGYVTKKGVFGSEFVGEKKSPKRRKKASKSRSRRSQSTSWF